MSTLKVVLIAAICIASVKAGANADMNIGGLGTPDKDDIEYPDDEEPSDREILLGKTLFYDTRLSRHHNQSCATCHNPELGFSDGLAKGIGSGGDILGRNAPHLYNLAWSVTFFWDGRAASLEEQALGPLVSDMEMQMTPIDVVKRLKDVKFYRDEFAQIYGEISFENVGRAIAAFERTIISDNSPFDQYLAGNKLAMSPSAIRGLSVFVGKGRCTKCHDGENFTDDSFHNIGIDNKDNGRFELDKSAQFKGAFKTPGLRNIIMSAPYMHDGSLGTLEEVVDHYDKGAVGTKNVSPLIVPLNLSTQEKADLVAFMAALTDPVVIQRPIIPQ